jgi:hypothetical protein
MTTGTDTRRTAKVARAVARAAIAKAAAEERPTPAGVTCHAFKRGCIQPHICEPCAHCIWGAPGGDQK